MRNSLDDDFELSPSWDAFFLVRYIRYWNKKHGGPYVAGPQMYEQIGQRLKAAGIAWPVADVVKSDA